MDNHKPSIKHGVRAYFVEGDAPQLISSELFLLDRDSSTLAGATVWISRNYQAGSDFLYLFFGFLADPWVVI